MSDLDETVQLGHVALKRMLAIFATDIRTAIEVSVDLFVALLERSMCKCRYYDIPAEAISFWRETVSSYQVNEETLGAILLSTLIVRTPELFPSRSIPAAITKEFYDQLHRIAIDLHAAQISHMSLDNDIFLKDLGICRLEVFPCSALLVDKNSGIPHRLALNNGFRQFLHVADLVAFKRLRFSPYFEIHAHTPMIGNFNPEGWDRCYHLVAELLHLYPEYQGLVGGSWFFDPVIEQISPHLAYLRLRAHQRGAFFLRVGSSEADISNATAKSMSRRKLYEERKYLPTKYLLVWPRKNLLDWADHHSN